MKPLRMSNTDLSMFQRCGEQYRRARIEKERLPPGLKMTMGSAFHRVAAANHQRQMAALEQGVEESDVAAYTLPDEEARDISATAFQAQIKSEGLEISEKEAEEYGGKARAMGVGLDRVVAAGAHYSVLVAPGIVPDAVERKIELELGDKALTVTGRIDLIARERPEPDRIIRVVRDNKLTGKAPAKNAADTSQQLTFYSLLHKAETGTPPERLSLDFMQHGAKGVKHVVQATTRDEMDVKRLARRISAAVDAIRAGVFIPANPDSYWCSPSWCGYWSTCRFGGGK